MEFREFGLILFVERYEECIEFYKNKLRLNVRRVKDSLVSFELPHGYLMVERGGVSSNLEKTRDKNPTIIRFDVEKLEPVVRQLEEQGICFMKREVKFSWGSIAIIIDPDGNRIELGELNHTSGSFVE